MKKQLLGLIALSLIVISACEKEGKNKGSEESNIYDNSEIALETHFGSRIPKYSIKKGSYLVFERKYVAQDDEGIADDEYAEEFVFQIDKSEIYQYGDNKGSFYLSDSSLKASNPVYRYHCFCQYSDSVKNFYGSIHGRKISPNKWEVNVDAFIIYVDKIDDDNPTMKGYRDRSHKIRFKEVFTSK